jgi:SAM-dependent methyltransferase
VVFGEAADLYDRARPGYPQQLVADVVAFAGVDDPRILEIGAGTGKATTQFAARGVEIVAIEPSAEMAAVARRNCAAFPRVSIRVSDFEDWQNDTGPFDLLLSAQAWHWIAPDVRYMKAARLLEPSGCLALFWNRPVWASEAMRTTLEDVYRTFAPELHAEDPGFPGLTPSEADVQRAHEIEESRLFGPVTYQTYQWSDEYSTEQFLELQQTQSNHRMFPADRRERLLGEIARVIDDAGGTLTMSYATHLYLARRLVREP